MEINRAQARSGTVLSLVMMLSRSHVDPNTQDVVHFSRELSSEWSSVITSVIPQHPVDFLNKWVTES